MKASSVNSIIDLLTGFTYIQYSYNDEFTVSHTFRLYFPGIHYKPTLKLDLINKIVICNSVKKKKRDLPMDKQKLENCTSLYD